MCQNKKINNNKVLTCKSLTTLETPRLTQGIFTESAKECPRPAIIGPDLKKKNRLSQNCEYFLSVILNYILGGQKEPSHRESSFEYPQHIFWLENNINPAFWRPCRDPRFCFSLLVC